MFDSLSQLEKKLIAAGHEIIENKSYCLITSLGRFSIVHGQLIKDHVPMMKDELADLNKLLNL